MSVSSVASSGVNTYQPQTAKAAAVASNTPVASDDDAQSVSRGCGHHRGGRQNTLVNAMMAAFKALGIGQPAASTPAATTATTPAAATEAATTAGTATDTAKDIEKAVHEFAHELFQALRGDGNSEQTHGHHGHHEHHDHDEHRSERAGGYGRGYGDLAQRIGQLAQTLGAPAASATTATSSTATAATGSAATAPAATTPATTPVTTTAADTPAASTTTPAASTTPAAPATGSGNRLLAAFTKLFAALQPKTTSTATPAADTPATDMAAKLKQFLQTLAQSMKPEAASAPAAATGSLLNVTA